MTIKRSLSILLFLALVSSPAALRAEEALKGPAGWVNDYAGVISPKYRDKLAALIEELRAKTSAEIFVVTAGSIAPYDEKGYARLIFDSWKPGKKGRDNGVVVLLAMKERRWRIETGYGVEGILPDGRCGEIGRSYMVPYFKEGKFGEGLYYGVLIIADTIAKDAGVKLDSLSGVDVRPASTSDYSKNTFEAVKAAFILFFAGMVTPVFIGLFLVLFSCVIIFSNLSRTFAVVPFVIYLIVSVFRFTSWRNLPRSKRGNFFTYAGSGSGSGGWGGGGFGGGGFGSLTFVISIKGG